MLTEKRTEALFSKIRDAGFPLVGAVDLERAIDEFRSHSIRYEEWIRAGMHGEMAYLERGLERRLDPRKVFPETKAVIACAIPYRRASPSSGNSPRYARYLQGPDYHTLLPRLLSGALNAWADSFDPTSRPKWKICVDTSAILERSWAALCGLGWIGKNTLLIHPKLGSYLFLATILIDQEFGKGPEPLPNYCGNCTKCLEGCPTSAIVRPGTVDSRKCISYLTLEKRGDWSIDESVRKKMGTWIAGCDICQEVCPYNLKPTRLEETWPRDERDVALEKDWNRLESEDEASYRMRVSRSALSRIKFLEMKRNLENSAKNAGQVSSPSTETSPPFLVHDL